MGAAYIDLSDNATISRIKCKHALAALFRGWPLRACRPGGRRWRERPGLRTIESLSVCGASPL